MLFSHKKTLITTGFCLILTVGSGLVNGKFFGLPNPTTHGVASEQHGVRGIKKLPKFYNPILPQKTRITTGVCLFF